MRCKLRFVADAFCEISEIKFSHEKLAKLFAPWTFRFDSSVNWGGGEAKAVETGDTWFDERVAHEVMKDR